MNPELRSVQKEIMNGSAAIIGINIVLYPENAFLITFMEANEVSLLISTLSMLVRASNTVYVLPEDVSVYIFEVKHNKKTTSADNRK